MARTHVVTPWGRLTSWFGTLPETARMLAATAFVFAVLIVLDTFGFPLSWPIALLIGAGALIRFWGNV